MSYITLSYLLSMFEQGVALSLTLCCKSRVATLSTVGTYIQYRTVVTSSQQPTKHTLLATHIPIYPHTHIPT